MAPLNELCCVYSCLHPDSNSQIPDPGFLVRQVRDRFNLWLGREETVFSSQHDLYVAANCVTLGASQEQHLYGIIWRLSLYFHLTVVLT